VKPREIKWRIVFERDVFPWRQVAFEPYTANQCFDRLNVIVKNGNEFNSKILQKRKVRQEGRTRAHQEISQINSTESRFLKRYIRNLERASLQSLLKDEEGAPSIYCYCRLYKSADYMI